MNQIIILNIHSTIDVITNSSTELFVINNNTIKAVNEMLQFLLDKWNEMAAKGVFGPYYETNKRTSLDNKNLSNPKPILSFEDIFEPVFILTKEIYENRKNDGYDWCTKSNIGKIIIESAYDNSIPGELMEWIETSFGGYKNVNRFHLG